VVDGAAECRTHTSHGDHGVKPLAHPRDGGRAPYEPASRGVEAHDAAHPSGKRETEHDDAFSNQASGVVDHAARHEAIGDA